MKTGCKQLLLFCGGAIVLSLGCRSTSDGDRTSDENLIIPDGKEDNFFSNTAQEYLAEAEAQIQLEPSERELAAEERLARATRLMEQKTRQIGWFLHLYLIDKSHEDAGATYGGMRAMVLDGSYQSDGLKPDPEDPLTFRYVFRMQVGGSKQLLAKICADKRLPVDANVFPLQMARLSNTSLLTFSTRSYSAGKWTPATCNCELEVQNVKLSPIEASSDAYLDYGRFFEDGVLDISVHFGWDYHARYDLTHSRTFYNWLVNRMGFTSPAQSYEAYHRLSGPLTKTITVNGAPIEVRINVYHPDPCEAWNEDGSGGAWAKAVAADKTMEERACPDWAWEQAQGADPSATPNANPTTSVGAGNLKQDLVNAMQTRDVILFAGHSGYTYAYAMASWYRTSAGDLDPPEIKTLPLPAQKSQLFALSGCDTYHVSQAFKDNPTKLGLHNADVITTTSFSDAGDVGNTQDLVRALVGDEWGGRYRANTFGLLLTDLNPSTYDSSNGYFSMYGVHGIDDNPRANPLGDPQKSCTPCENDTDCGALGNVCVRLSEREKVCAVECVHDAGCGAGQLCKQFGSTQSGSILGRACVPSALVCAAPPPVRAEKSFSATGAVDYLKEQSFTVQLGPGATNIKVALTGDGDADLYTNFSVKPTQSKYACRPFKSGSTETCTHDKAQSEVLAVLVRGWAKRTSNFRLNATWTALTPVQ